MNKSLFSNRVNRFDKSVKKPNNDSSSMSIEKPVDEQPCLLSNNNSKDIQTVISNNWSARVHCLAQQAVNPIKPHIIYSKTLPNVIGTTAIKKKLICFRQSDYIISGWSGTGFPNVIYIAHTIPDFDVGYQTIDGLSSKRLAALQLTEISPILDEAQVKTFDLRYSLRDPITWGVPLSTTTLEFELYIDDETIPVTLPLPNPMTLNFECRYERM